nr:MAG TPA: hypothetical protein [Caudoviricetes sp.]
MKHFFVFTSTLWAQIRDNTLAFQAPFFIIRNVITCDIVWKFIIQRHLGRTNSILHIQHFINAFQPVAYRRPTVMRLCCNVRQRKPLNVPQ